MARPYPGVSQQGHTLKAYAHAVAIGRGVVGSKEGEGARHAVAMIAGGDRFAVEAAHQQYVAVADTLDATQRSGRILARAAAARAPRGDDYRQSDAAQTVNRPFMKPAISRSPDRQLAAIVASICPLAHPCSPARWRRLSKRR